jgi:hypothetical protein
MFGSYSKLIGAVLGNLVGIVVVYLAAKGLATCAPAPQPDLEEVCSVMGLTTGEITNYVMVAINALFVYAFPANKPNA